ncbi:MAG: hypothetical protein Q7K57_52300 [Burkholderiaceae bacterium]|nr:hypothetical protein [Burkholderiaceae bacterium]
MHSNFEEEFKANFLHVVTSRQASANKFKDSSESGLCRVLSPLGAMLEVYKDTATHHLCTCSKLRGVTIVYDGAHPGVIAEFFAFNNNWGSFLQLVTENIDARNHILELMPASASRFQVPISEVHCSIENHQAEAICRSLNAVDACQKALK